MEQKIPTCVVDIIELINNQNKQCYIIGGAPRDMLLGHKPNDFDLCTDISLIELQTLMPHFHLMKQTELRNAGITRIGETIIEISEFKGRTLEEDILKRDFTINGIAMDNDGNIIDPYNYQQDIKNKTLTLIDKTGRSIIENPMLILRAMRIASQYDLSIDENTKKNIKSNGVNLTKVIGQRAYGEFSKLLLTENFPYYLDEYFKIFIMLIPELINIPELDKTYKQLSLSPKNLVLKLASLFTYNKNNIQDFTQFANRMCIDKKTIKLVSLLLSYKNRDIDVSQSGINRTIQEFNIQNVDLLFAYKKLLLTLDNQDTNYLTVAQQKYQTVIDDIITTRISQLKINQEKIQTMGFNQEEAKLIYEDVKGRILTNTLQNTEYSIEAYILNKHKKS